MEFSVLGPLELSERGELLTLRRGLPRALVVFLLLHRRAPVSADVLADRLWSGEPPLDAANAVQRVVSYVRRSLGRSGPELLLTRPAGYALAVADEAVDVVRFERLVGVAVELGSDQTAAAAARSVDVVEQALRLWRADPLSDVSRYPWAVGEIARLEELHVQARAVRLDALLLLNRLDEAVREARVLVSAHPLQEQFHARLMLALYRSGRQSEALTAYPAARRLLDEELGLDPGPQLQALETRVLNQDTELEWRPPPDWTSPADQPAVGMPTAVPVPLTSLVGRQQALADLRGWLSRTSLLTLTGPGGVGKTRLAAELARGAAREALWWADLGLVGAPELVAPTIARTVGVTVAPGEDAVEAVSRGIGDTAGLLVLDGCEQVADAAAGLAGTLHRSCPNLSLVVTSRQPLRLTGEVTWSVPPLDLPEDSGVGIDPERFSAVELFRQRAEAARPGFGVDDGNAAEVMAIVRALDGLPLAIELAAAHVDVLPLSGIRERLTDRFELLRNDHRDAPARQHTLRAVIDASAALLSQDERRHFRRLGVFAGSFDLDAVEEVTGSSAASAYRLTASLARQSLVVALENGRYRLLESVRAYAADDLARSPEVEEVRQRHTEHLLTLMATADEGLRGAGQEVWLTRVRDTLPDLRAALAWSLAGGDLAGGARLAAVSTWFWTLEGMLDEAARWVEKADAAEVDDPGVRAAVLHALGRVAAPRGDLHRARDACAASAAIYRQLGDAAGLARALVTLGLSQWALGDLPAAAGSHEEAVERAAGSGDRWHHTAALILRLRTGIDTGEPDLDQRLTDALTHARGSGDQHLLGLAFSQQGRLAQLNGDPEGTEAAARQALRSWRSVGYREGEVQARNLLARAALRLQRPDEAAVQARKALLTAADIGHSGGQSESLECLAAARHAAGDAAEALQLLTVAADERLRSAIPVPAAEATQITSLLRELRGRLGAETGRVVAAAHRRDLREVVSAVRASG